MDASKRRWMMIRSKVKTIAWGLAGWCVTPVLGFIFGGTVRAGIWRYVDASALVLLGVALTFLIHTKKRVR